MQANDSKHHHHEHAHSHAHAHSHSHGHNHPHNDFQHAYEVEKSQAGANTRVADPSHIHRDEYAPIEHHSQGPLRVGVGGPVGSGKTALVAALCKTLGSEFSLAVVTNDIYTTEDADFLLKNAVIDADRVIAVETGGCPHSAIRDDISTNLETVEELEEQFPDLDLILIESGGDNLTATFSRGLIHEQIFVIDVAGGDRVPRKGGPGTATSDLLMINKTDLAPYVGADLAVMEHDAREKRGDKPFVMTSLVQDPAATEVATWVREKVHEYAQKAAGKSA